MDVFLEVRKLVGAWDFLSGEGLRLRDDERAVVELWKAVEGDLEAVGGCSLYDWTLLGTAGSVLLGAFAKRVFFDVERSEFDGYALKVSIGDESVFECPFGCLFGSPRTKCSRDFKRFLAALWKWSLKKARKTERSWRKEVQKVEARKTVDAIGRFLEKGGA